MKTLLRKWKGNVFVEEEGPHIGAYEGLAFRRMNEKPATATNFGNLRVTEIYLSAKEDALILYCEERKEER